MGVSEDRRRPLHVLLVEVPGNSTVRIECEATAAAAGHVLAIHPAESDVLLVCGTPGPELRTVIDRVWDQIPYPKHRATLTSPDEIGAVLWTAQDALANQPAQRSAAREDQDMLDHADEPMHHDDTTMGGHDDMSMGHMSMSGPGGYPLAEGADDRDGLEMDVLHRRLGPILPAWPAGMVLDVTLAGDTITDASASMVDVDDYLQAEPRNVAAMALDQAAQVLAVAGWDAAAARALRVRDLTVTGHGDQARERLLPLRRRIERSVLLRWSLRGLHIRPDVDVHAVLLARLERATVSLSAAQFEPEPATPADEIPALIKGRDIGSARLIIAALTVHPGRRADTTGQAGAPREHHHG